MSCTPDKFSDMAHLSAGAGVDRHPSTDFNPEIALICLFHRRSGCQMVSQRLDAAGFPLQAEKAIPPAY
jgi:hypothetical protein